MERTGLWYHVTGRGIERRSIFTDVRDRQHWLELVAQTVSLFRLAVHAYVQMGGLKLGEPGALAGGVDYAAVSVAVKRFEQRLTRDAELRRITDEIKRQIVEC